MLLGFSVDKGLINMEYDRFNESRKLFIVGIITLLLSLSLLAFGLYILPYLLWNWFYKVPGFILKLREWFREEYKITEILASWFIFFMLIIPALVFGYISYKISNSIDNQIYHIDTTTPEKKFKRTQDFQDSAKIGLKIIGLIVLILIIIAILQSILRITP